jgi:hypothetical protein
LTTLNLYHVKIGAINIMKNNELTAFAFVIILAISSIALSLPYMQNSNDSKPIMIDPTQNFADPIKLKTKIENPIFTDCIPAMLAKGAQIRILGAYEGGGETRLSIESNESVVGRIKLHASASGGPIILVLSAYDPVVWDFSQFPVNRIRAVFATGYSDQAVAALPEHIPLQLNSHNTPNTQCGKPSYAYKGGEALDGLTENVAMIFGRGPDSFQGTYAPKSFNVDGQAINAALYVDDALSNNIRAARNVSVDSISPRDAGLVQLVNAGKIRPANANDIALLSKALTAASPSGSLAPIEVESSIGYRLYVVLAPTTLPKGMYGGNLANFIIPSGVPMPTDPGSHNTYFRLADGSCMGPMCNH